MRRLAGRLGIIAAIAVVGLGAPGASHANFAPTLTINVTKTADDSGLTCAPNDCSIRDALTVADNQPTGTLVAIKVPRGTYVLTNGTLTISNPYGLIVEIDGAGAAVTTIDGSGNAADTSDVEVDSPAQISGLTIKNGTGDNGAGIDMENGALTLGFSTVTRNRTNDPGGHGGGVYVRNWYTPLHLSNDTFSYNVAGQGGGVWTYNDTSVLDNVVLDHNIACDTFAVPALSPFDFHNTCVGEGDGGGLSISGPNNGSENATVNGGSITNNVAGSLATDQGEGGGVWGHWRTTLNHVTVWNNVAGYEGGGVWNGETGVVNGGSISNNLAGQFGAAIGNDGDHTALTGVTIANNVAGGTFACTETLDMLSNPVSATCTRATGTQANPAVNGCPMANTATYQCSAENGTGGAINSYDDISDQSSTFASNRAVSINPASPPVTPVCLGIGGAIYQSDGITLNRTQFKNNSASCGGAIYADSAPTSATSINVTTNRATFYGGGIFGNDVYHPSYMILDSSRVLSNSAGTKTGGVFDGALGDLVIKGATSIAGNAAPGSCKNTNNPCT
jgi:hypothetical protein